MGLFITIQCDICGEDDSDEPPMTSVIKGWREEGWLVGKDRHVCPDCRGR